MINTKEFRRGNYINDIALGVCEVVAIFTNSIEVCKLNKPNVSYLISNIEPIPLTEEWLLIMGFEKCEHKTEPQYYKDCEEISVRLFPKEKYFTLAYLGTEIKYLHELQNLYFALTGEELTIK